MKRTARVVPVLTALIVLFGYCSTVSATSSHNPAGNNGFIKINNETITDKTPENNPHVGCTFYVDFYNYDQNNNYANVDFALQAPTNGNSNTLTVTTGNLHPFIGSTPAGGSKDLDAHEAYTLSFTGPDQKNQGYHVKVTVDAPGSNGSEKKSKVFWVQSCTQKGEVLAAQTTAQNNVPTPANTAEAVSVLPNTGTSVSAMVGLFGGTVVFASIAYYFWNTRKIQLQK